MQMMMVSAPLSGFAHKNFIVYVTAILQNHYVSIKKLKSHIPLDIIGIYSRERNGIMERAIARSNARSRRKQKLVAIVCAMVILLSGTFAFQQIFQQGWQQLIGYIPELVTTGRLHSGQQVMGTNFGESEWRVGMRGDHSVFVENFADEDDGNDIFVRVRIFEYMEVGPGARLHPNDPGFDDREAQSIIAGANREDFSTWSLRRPQNDANSNIFRSIFQWHQGGQTVFMPTFNKDIMSMESDVRGDAKSMRPLGVGEVPNSTHQGQNHAHPPAAGRNDFFDVGDTHEALVKYWDRNLSDNGGHSIRSFTDTHVAKETLEATTVLMSAWDGTPGNFWVLDTDGWAYWGAPLAPGEATGLLLSGITKSTQQGTEWYYAIFPEAEMATADSWAMAWDGERNSMTIPARRLVSMISGTSPIGDTRPGGTFMDSTNVLWRVLAEDDDGFRLIITEQVHGSTAYHGTAVYVRLHLTDRLRPALNEWFDETLDPALRATAVPAINLENDVRSIAHASGNPTTATLLAENAEAGWTSAGRGQGTGANALFVLSISEFNRYRLGADATLNAVATTHGGTTAASWWLRSPGTLAVSSNHHSTGVNATGAAETASPTTTRGFRPAMWVRP